MVFHYDMVGTEPWFDVMPLIDYEETVEETEEWKITRNGAGGSLKYWKHKMGTPEHIDFRMTNRAIWERDYRDFLVDFSTPAMLCQKYVRPTPPTPAGLGSFGTCILGHSARDGEW